MQITTGFETNQVRPIITVNDPTIIVRFLRKNEVTFIGTSLCPDKVPNFFFDETNINSYCSKSNFIEVSSASDAEKYVQGEGIIDNTSNSFAKVLTVSNNIVYIDQNFVTLNVTAYGANVLSSSNYSFDDVIFQKDSSNTVCFQGKVEYFDSSNGVMAILPSVGTLNVSTGGVESIIYKNGSTILSNASTIIRGTVFPTSGTIRGSSNTSNVSTIISYAHSSGSFTKSNGSNTFSVMVQANSSYAVGNTFTIVSGSGMGEIRTVSAVGANNSELVMNAAITGLTSNSRYSFGPHVVDDFGTITGIFNIPETEDEKFAAGKRLFTITDTASSTNNAFLMKATTFYNVIGEPIVIYPPPPPPPRPQRRDPIAQTFYTPRVTTSVNGLPKSDYGIFISSVDLFFSAKPILASFQDQMPVTVQIVQVENGTPTEKIIAFKSVEAKNINVSLVPDAANNDTITNFRFDDPVYLEADTQYALVVRSDSPDYFVYICELGQSILGAVPPRRVSSQPYVGSFFKSQNASTWTPIQNQDLMFRIKKCVFPSNQQGTVLFKPVNQLANVNIDSILIHSAELNHKPTTTQYKFRSNNVSGIQDSVYTYVPVNSIYRFGGDLLTSTKSSARRRVLVSGDNSSLSVGVEFNTSDTDVSPLVNIERPSIVAYENLINDASISNTDISVTSIGVHSNAANITVTISAPDLVDGTQASASVSSLASGGVATIVMSNPGSGYITSPTITLSEPAATSNATAVISGETASSGGNAKNRYITKQVTLADGFDAGDMRVYIDCNRPAGTNIHVYYKVKSSSDPENFTDKKWQLMNKVSDINSADQNQIIELEFRPNLLKNVLSYIENNIVYPLGGTFKYYAIKIVMTAEDSTVVPTIRNYRAIAIPAG